MKLTKYEILIGVLLVAVAPWLAGGKEPLALLITLGVLFIGLFLAWRLPETPQPIGFDRLALAGWGLAGWATLSLIWSANRYQTVVWLIPLVFALAVFTIARRLHSRWRETKLFVQGYMMLAAVFALVGFYLYLTVDYPRLTTSFYWANPAAAWFLPAVLWGAWYWAETKEWFYLISGGLAATAFVLTDSRSSYLTLVVILVAVAVTLRRKAPFWRRLGLMLVVIVTLTVGLNLLRGHVFHLQTSIQGSRLADAARGESVSRTDRIYYIRSALAIWRTHPVIGTGAGTYASQHPKYQYRVVSAASNTHNLYAQTLSELGLVGFGLLVWLVVEILLGLWRKVKTDRRYLPLAIVAAAMLVHLGLDIDAEYPAILLLIAALVGSAWRERAIIEAKSPKPVIYPAAVALALIVVAWPVRDLYQSQVWATRAQSEQDNGDYQSAASDFARAHAGLVYDPNLLVSEGINRYTLAKWNMDAQANLKQAESLALSSARLDPAAGEPYLLLARSLRKGGQVREAEQAYKQAITLDPFDDPDYYTDLAQLYIANHDTASAKIYLDQILSLYTDAVVSNRHVDETIPQKISNALTTRGSLYLTEHQTALAKNDLERAIKWNKQNLVAQELLNNLDQQKP